MTSARLDTGTVWMLLTAWGVLLPGCGNEDPAGGSSGGSGTQGGGSAGGSAQLAGSGGSATQSAGSSSGGSATGGASANGGTSPSGGQPAQGGTATAGSGGSPSGGGALGQGGTTAGSANAGGTSSGDAPLTNRAGSIPVGIENVNDSPLKSADYRALLRFVPDATIDIDRMYFGFKLKGASCWDSGNAGYGAGDGGTLHASLVNVDPTTGLPTTEIVSETVNGCDRHNEAAQVVGSDPVMVWVNTPAKLLGGKLYALIISNTHPNAGSNFFSFNMPLADTALAGSHTRNELSQSATGAILGLDPREHVAWSKDGGKTWDYGSLNGQYRSYMNDHDTAHPATRMPQYGFRLANQQMLGVQPYYAYSTDCSDCAVTFANARYARSFSELGGFTASGSNVGELSIKNETTGEQASCTPTQGYGFRKCTLVKPVSVAVGQSYTVACSGSVEVMELDNPQRIMFPNVGTKTGELRMFQASPAAGTNAKDIPNLWAGPTSAQFPTATDKP